MSIIRKKSRAEKFFGGEPIAVENPSIELIKQITDSICTAMTLAGVNAFEDWVEDPANVENEELANLVSSVYAAMRAQQIALEAQIPEDA